VVKAGIAREIVEPLEADSKLWAIVVYSTPGRIITPKAARVCAGELGDLIRFPLFVVALARLTYLQRFWVALAWLIREECACVDQYQDQKFKDKTETSGE